MPLTATAPDRGFNDAEFSARTAKAQVAMAASGLAGMLLMSEQDVRYFTGFHTLFWQSPTRPWFVFVPASGKPVAVIPEIGAELIRRGWIDDIRTWSAPSPQDDGRGRCQDFDERRRYRNSPRSMRLIRTISIRNAISIHVLILS